MQKALIAGGLALGLVVALTMGTDGVRANNDTLYGVQVTNLTNAQSFTPFLAATHVPDVTMFRAGSPASPELQVLAEGGDIAPLMGVLSATSGVSDIVSTEGLLTRGASVNFEIQAGDGSQHLSLAAMLIPTNDAFVGINTPLPAGGQVLVTYAYAYDAGTERNDELCASIPGPSFGECGGPGGGATVGGGEGAVTIHRGIQGVGDLDASRRDWRNPVARVTIRRLP